MQARGLYSSNVLESKSHCRTKPSSSLPLLYLAVPLSILYILLGRSGWKIVPVNVWAQMHVCVLVCVREITSTMAYSLPGHRNSPAEKGAKA